MTTHNILPKRAFPLYFVAFVLFCLPDKCLALSLEIPPSMTWDSLKAYLLFTITLFIPLSALSYSIYRRNIRCRQLNYYLNILCSDDGHKEDLVRTFGHDTSLTSHIDSSVLKPGTEEDVEEASGFGKALARLLISVLLASVVAFLGMSTLFYADTIIDDMSEPNVFLGGMEAVNYDKYPIKLDCSVVKGAALIKQCKEVNKEQFTSCKSITNTDLKTLCIQDRKDSLYRYQMGALLMTGMASLGAVLWGLHHIVRRYIMFDISSGVYYSMAVRVLTASIVAVVFYHSMDAMTDGLFTLLSANGTTGAEKGDKISSILPSLALLIGMFPQRGINMLKEKFTLFSDDGAMKVKKLPLSMIEGITQHEIIRLNEISIDNCYILAEQRVIPLILMTPFSPNLIINFIAQAKLCVYFPEAVDELREVGIRNILHVYNPKYGTKEEKKKFMEILRIGHVKEQEPKSFEENIVDETKVKLAHVKHVIAEIGTDWTIKELNHYFKRLDPFGEDEKEPVEAKE